MTIIYEIFPILGGIGIEQIHIISSYLVFGCNFAFDDCLKPATHRHHQMLGIYPADALPGLYYNQLQFLFIMGYSGFSLVFRKCNAC